jgi:hypothetical protein
VKTLTAPLPKDTYIVERASARWEPTTAPCQGAEKKLVVSVDERIVDDPKKIGAYGHTDAWWYGRGTNHRVENGHIKRDIGVNEVYVLKIPDIWAFIEKHGDCVLSINSEGFRVVEIYDDYRE